MRLFFINEKEAYTDGKNIVVDPASDELFSTKDTNNVAKKIEKDGINIIGVALEKSEGETECYETLKEIYDRVVDVKDMKHLTTQLLNLISKLFM